MIITSVLLSQNDCADNRYIDEIFSVDVQYEIEYGENINQTLLGCLLYTSPSPRD